MLPRSAVYFELQADYIRRSAQAIVSSPGDPCDQINGSNGLDSTVYRLENKYHLEIIRHCSVFYQNIYFDEDTDEASWKDTTGINDTILDLGNITHIKGDLYLSPNNLPFKYITAKNLVQIDGQLSVDTMSSLVEIDMPALRSVGQYSSGYNHRSLEFGKLPNLERVQFDPAGISVAFANNGSQDRAVWIAWTGLQKIDFLRSGGISNDYQTTTLDALQVLNNPQLRQIDLPELTGSLGFLNIGNNSADLTVTMAKLETARDVIINNIRELNLPELRTTQSLEISNNTLAAINLGKLGTVGETLSIWDNPLLTTLSLSNLAMLGHMYLDKHVYGGNLTIDSNPNLRHIDLDALAMVGESIRIVGPFDRYIMPTTFSKCIQLSSLPTK